MLSIGKINSCPNNKIVSITLRKPLKKSIIKTSKKIRFDFVTRNEFNAPTLPEPVWVISKPWNFFKIINAVEKEPIRYPIVKLMK